MTKIIAEIGINHNGDLEIAKKLIDVAYLAGCDYVKFQKRDIESVYTKEELDKPRESPWGTTTREQKEGLEFSWHDYNEINRYCKNKIKWLVSAWDVKSLKAMTTYEHDFTKVPSALLTDTAFLMATREIAEKFDRKAILSTGMSDMHMVDFAVDMIGEENIECIMMCTSTYPSKTEELNLKCIDAMQHKYSCKVGFSNHHPGVIFMPIAVAMGAQYVEFHITMDRAMYGSDQAASIEPEGVYKLVKYIRSAEIALGDGIKKIYDSEIPIIEKLRK